MTTQTATLELAPLVERHSDRLLARIQQYIQDLDEAKDVLQDVWLQVIKKYHTYTGTGSIEGWTLSIARNACLMELRSPARNPHTQAATAQWENRWYGKGSYHASPETQLIRNDLQRDIWRSIAKLPTRQRKAVILRLVEGRSTAETANAMGCSISAVKSYMHRAVRRLRVSLAHWQPALAN